ncbi:hypothetical protein [Streptomyces katrae]|uniref:hypothetical protein n=1 Tax=Streptomyces katrae TaxID=68223 RepID=UPI00131D38EA|nr:hypothetical protein [Streptomyces katrae]
MRFTIRSGTSTGTAAGSVSRSFPVDGDGPASEVGRPAGDDAGGLLGAAEEAGVGDGVPGTVASVDGERLSVPAGGAATEGDGPGESSAPRCCPATMVTRTPATGTTSPTSHQAHRGGV